MTNGAWPEGWVALDERAEEAAGLERELRAELAEGHPLHGHPAHAIGHNQRDDDVLFHLEDTDELAVVRLTWARRPESPPFPRSIVYPDFDTFAAAGRGASP